MNKSQIACFDKNYMVINLCERNIEIIKTVIAFYNFFLILKLNVAEMHSTGDQQSKKNTGIATGKRNVRQLLEEQCDTIASVVGAYAIDTKNPELEERINTNSSKLKVMAGAKLLSFGRQLQQELITYKDGLAGFSITPELTAAFDELLEEFAVQVAAPSNATATRKVQGKKLKELVKQNNFIHKKQMRPVAKLFKKSHPWL